MSNEYLFQQQIRALRPYIVNRLSKRGEKISSIERKADEIMEAANRRFMGGDDRWEAQDLIDDII